ncbi:MAG: KpsF/GutQ family sugar-phosphate isomerase [Roseococcus sp.]
MSEVLAGVIRAEGQALMDLALPADQACAAVALITSHDFITITTGVGKSGLVAAKVAATMSSLGLPAAFLDPTSAAHGDLGLVRPGSVVIAFSNSGNSAELIAILPALAARGAKLIAVVGDPASGLARAAAVPLCYGKLQEADGLVLAPTTSTTVQMAIGDALAVGASVAQGLSPEGFHANHPAGSLGRRLSRVDQVMRKGADVPRVANTASFIEVIDEISARRVGLVCVVDTEDRLLGIISDGDVRRALRREGDPRALTVAELIRKDPETISPDLRLADVLDGSNGLGRHLSLPVVGGDGILRGVLVGLDVLR